jgi:hypothetical protein
MPQSLPGACRRACVRPLRANWEEKSLEDAASSTARVGEEGHPQIVNICHSNSPKVPYWKSQG